MFSRKNNTEGYFQTNNKVNFRVLIEGTCRLYYIACIIYGGKYCYMLKSGTYILWSIIFTLTVDQLCHHTSYWKTCSTTNNSNKKN